MKLKSNIAENSSGMKLKRDRISSIILLAENMIKLFFLCLLVNMHITLSFQSDEDWSFDEHNDDDRGVVSSQNEVPGSVTIKESTYTRMSWPF